MKNIIKITLSISICLIINSKLFGAPVAITDLMMAKAHQIYLLWTAPENGAGGGCTGYIVKYSSVGNITNETEFNNALTFNQTWIPGTPHLYQQVIITGFLPNVTYWFSIKSVFSGDESNISDYDNDTNHSVAGEFADIGADIENVGACSLTWGDYDNDGDLDLALMGHKIEITAWVNNIYRNDNNNFVLDKSLPAAVYWGELCWGDYDNDGDLDLIKTGTGGLLLTRIYRNDNSSFNESGILNLRGAYRSSLAWGDYDNDGDLDFAIAGLDNTNNSCRIYQNENCNFNDINAGLTGVQYCSLGWADYDNDGDLDLAVSGNVSAGNNNTSIYRNSNNNFSNINTVIYGLSGSSLAWGDYDNDGDLDIAISGLTNTNFKAFLIYNNNNGNFSTISAELTAFYSGDLCWGDYDNDGDLDLAACGDTGTGGYDVLTEIYRNDTSGFYAINEGFLSIGYSYEQFVNPSLTFGDFNNDGGLDVAAAGIGYAGAGPYSRIYKSLLPEYGNTNTVPTSPVLDTLNTNYNHHTEKATFRWNYGSDTQTTQQQGLYYEIRVATDSITDGLTDWVVSPSSGLGMSPFMGNYNHGFIASGEPGLILNITTEKLTYYWQVRTIDTGLKCSAWSLEGSVYADNPPPEAINTLIVVPNEQDTSSTIYWEEPKADGASGDTYNYIGAYWVKYSSEVIHTWDAMPYFSSWTVSNIVPGNGQTHHIDNLMVGVTYYFYIKTQDEEQDNWSAVSNKASRFMVTPPPAGTERPDDVFGVRIKSLDSTSIKIGFSPLTRRVDGTSLEEDLAWYDIYRATSIYGTWQSIDRVYLYEALEFTDTHNGTKYYYRIRAKDIYDLRSDGLMMADTDNVIRVLSEDFEAMLIFDNESKDSLYSSTNNGGVDIQIKITEETQGVGGDVICIYKYKGYNTVRWIEVQNMEQLENQHLEGPLLWISYKDRSVNTSLGEPTLYWHNTVKLIKANGTVDNASQSISMRTRVFGDYYLKLTDRSDKFKITSVEPRIFSPDEPNIIISRMRIFIENPNNAEIKSKVFDMNGRVIIKDLPKESDNVIFWDGKDVDGEIVSSGVYIYQLQCDGKVLKGTIVVAR